MPDYHLTNFKILIRMNCCWPAHRELSKYLALFLCFVFPLPLIKTSACTEMEQWALQQESSIFSGVQHLNKPLSFFISICLTSLPFMRAGSQNLVSVTIFGYYSKCQKCSLSSLPQIYCIKIFILTI